MATNKASVKLLLNAAVVLIASQSTAHAYLDLGTGSFILQAALAGIAATWLTCSTYWHRIKSMFQRKSVDTHIDAGDTKLSANKESEPTNQP